MILQEIEIKTIERINALKKIKSLEDIKKEAYEYNGKELFRFEKSLRENRLSFICEVKKASPSKGIIAEDFPYLEIAKDYEKAGAAAISVLTEPFYFKGSDDFLKEISAQVNTPLLRKDFTVDEYMIYEAKIMGADAILLICAILSQSQLEEYKNIAENLGLSVLVETHDEKEMEMAIKAGAGIIGVNNRDLKTFEVNIETSIRLGSMVPYNCLFVSESGIKTREDIVKLEAAGVDAFLIGETLMRSNEKIRILSELKGEI